MGREEEDEEGEEEPVREPGVENHQVADPSNTIYTYLLLIKQYSDLTKETFEATYNKGIIEFLNIIAFNVRFEQERLKAIEEFKKRN